MQPKQRYVLRAGILYNESLRLIAICFNTAVCTRCQSCRRTKPRRSSSETSLSMHYSLPGTKEKRMGRKKTTLPTDSSAAECTGCQTKSFDVFNRPWIDIYNSGSRKVNSAHWFTWPTQCLEIRCCCTGLRSCGLAYWLLKRSSCSDWQCCHKTSKTPGGCVDRDGAEVDLVFNSDRHW